MDIEVIKERLKIEQIIGSDVELEMERNSRYLRGKEHDSLVVDVHQQRYFWNSRGHSGDALDWCINHRGLDFKEALRLLAQEAGVELPAWSPEEAKQAEARRDRESIFEAAMGWFQSELFKSPAAMDYCRGRGWTEETLQAAGLGYYPGPAGPLKKALVEAGVDVEQPAAKALLKLKRELLIYPHVKGGRVTYLSGRGITGKIHDNPHRDLVGARLPMFNHVYTPTSERVVIVEGQADAISLGQWQIPAIALAGCSSDNALLAGLSRHQIIVLGLDADQAGQTNADKLAKALMQEHGKSAVAIRRVVWPEGDANGWLQAGATAEQALALVANATAWIDVLAQRVEEAEGDARDLHLRGTFDALASLDNFEISQRRDDLSRRLEVKKKEFDEMLKAARRENHDEGSAKYLVEGGRLCRRHFSFQTGEEIIIPLCNFVAEISEDVKRDNGMEVNREMVLTGRVNGYTLPEARVSAADFTKMNWVVDQWGSRAIVHAESRTEAHLRVAIQQLSAKAQRKTIYTHTGWRGIGGRRCYLSAGGAIGATEVEVELDTDLELYRLPSQPEDVNEAMAVSIMFLDLAPRRVTWPLWAAMFLAPLRELVTVGFAVWLFGGTGAMKSTLVSLALNHYGEGFDDKHLPGDFTDTANRLEQKMFTIKDAVLVVDDYAPQRDARSASEYNKTAARIVRAAGNLKGRGRLNADSTAKRTYTPRCLLVVTGEDLPNTESILNRLFQVEISRGDVNTGLLTYAQERRDRLPHAMSGYLNWISENWDQIKEWVPRQWRKHRQAAFGGEMHLRLPEAIAGLMLGTEVGLRYAHHLGVISQSEFDEMRVEAWNVFTAAANEQAKRSEEEKPEEMFVQALSDLLTQGKVRLEAKDGIGERVGGDSTSDLLGWCDTHNYYLLASASYNRIVHHFRNIGVNFPMKEQQLRKMLFERGYLLKDQGRYTQQLHVDGKNQRVLTMPRFVIEKRGQDQDADEATS